MARNARLKKTKRIRFDASMLFVGLCSLLGGYLVFTSYAAQHPNTTQPGVVSLGALPKNGIYYRFAFSDQLKYCFDAPQKYARFIIYDNQVLRESFRLDQGCALPKKSYKNPVISITGVSADSQLVITNQ